jgi:YVTN family beta-propeller protein
MAVHSGVYTPKKCDGGRDETTIQYVLSDGRVGTRLWRLRERTICVHQQLRQQNSVSVINTATNTVTATVAVGNNPGGIAVNPAGTFAYVANEFSNNVSVINTATNTVTATVNVGSVPFAFGQFIGPPPVIPTTPAPPTGLLVLTGLALVLGWFAFRFPPHRVRGSFRAS